MWEFFERLKVGTLDDSGTLLHLQYLCVIRFKRSLAVYLFRDLSYDYELYPFICIFICVHTLAMT